ncbi:hypothetical protein BO94DRAFT_534210 [Aspergillus sclerotioniger CBS 115572]|uniref:Uncharacterized protein n=1 Tax=Aspergillus sclerotioniger CBS 115572 TaxID=1450535 RepID=A0A317WXB7_9EURO|nr:hypothetical protein BO94DRAFT_534210 [Aspergillus sclerotioniger CBS 115572]PWY89438.1 hypothetical protein BO94DRAFT_534210 [Aspergillus sclerotioniger CBS 115572]
MSFENIRTADMPIRGHYSHFITEQHPDPSLWAPAPEIPFDRNTEDVPAPGPYRSRKTPIRNANNGAQGVIFPSSSSFCRSGDSTARDTDHNKRQRLEKDHREKQIQHMEDTHFTKVYKAKNECYHQQKLVAINRLNVRRLRASMREKREEEAGLRDSIRRHLGGIACCTCTSTASLIEKDHEALRSIAQSNLDLEYIHDQAEDELEEQEQELSRSAARLTYLFHPEAIRDSLEGNGSKEKARVFKADPQNSSPNPVSPNAYKSTLSQPQTQTSKSQMQEPIIFGTDEQHDPAPQIRKEATTTGPSEILQTWDGTEAKSCGDLPSLDQLLLDVLGLPSDEAHRQSLVEPDSANDPFKLALDEKFSPFDQGDSVESAPSRQRGRFINNWILHQLRTSSLESARLRSHPEWQTMRDQGWDDTYISRLALDRWHLDDTGTVASGERTIMPSQRSDGVGTTIWRGTGKPLYRRKRTRSVAFAPVPPLRRTSRHGAAWDGFCPEGQSSQEANRPTQEE